MPMALLPTRYLSVARAYAGAVHIPLEALERRTHELPPPIQEVWVIRDTPAACFALGWLHARGRRARLVDAPLPHADLTARYRLWRPNEWLEAVIESGEPVAKPCPRALDMGCGSGREAVYLAAQGWQVVAVDRLPEALARGRDLQQRYAPDGIPIEWVCADLEKSDWQLAGVFDCVTLFYFHAPELLARACAWLNKGGMLLVEAFTETHRAHFGKPARGKRVVRAGELPRLLPKGMRVVAYSEAWRSNGRHTARLWAVRD